MKFANMARKKNWFVDLLICLKKVHRMKPITHTIKNQYKYGRWIPYGKEDRIVHYKQEGNMWDYQEDSSPHKRIVGNRTNKQLKKEVNRSTC